LEASKSCLPKKRKLQLALGDMHKYLEKSFAASTRKQDHGSNWTWWEKWCAEWDEPPLRQYYHTFATMEEAKLEVFLQAASIPWILQRMRGRGRKFPLPSSAANIIKGIRRVHITKGYELPPLTLVNRVLAGICDEYIELHGPESLRPHRKEPIPFELICALMSWIKENVQDDDLKLSCITAVALLTQSGLRKAEISSIRRIFTKKCMSRASVTWLIDDVPVPHPTKQQFVDMIPRKCWAVVEPPPSKSDRKGTVWGNLPIYLIYDPSQRVNAASWLRTVELERPVPAHLKRETPLFVQSDGKPISATTYDSILRSALKALAPEDKHRYSWHSFRIHLACSLKEAGVPDYEIQALCRWQTMESLRIYARLNATTYTGFLDRAQNATIFQIQIANIPRSSGGDWDIDLDEDEIMDIVSQVRITDS
jgi:hypothetical protein